MNLPEKFQFRHFYSLGFTHSAVVVEGHVKVKWARGWHESRDHEEYDGPIWTETSLKCALEWVEKGEWIIVDEAKKEDSLPEEFYFTVANGEMPWYKASREAYRYRATWDGNSQGTTYLESQVKKFLADNYWKIIDKKPPTAEQLRANKEIREQIAALDQSIKHKYQDIEHANTLIRNYQQRVDDLKSKLVEE